MKVLQNFHKFWVLWHGHTELTEVPDGYKRCCTCTPGIVARGVQNSQKFRVRVSMSYITNKYSGTVMTVVQNFQKFRVMWHGRTELAEGPGAGMNVLQDLQKFRCGKCPGKCTPHLGGTRFEAKDFILLA